MEEVIVAITKLVVASLDMDKIVDQVTDKVLEKLQNTQHMKEFLEQRKLKFEDIVGLEQYIDGAIANIRDDVNEIASSAAEEVIRNASFSVEVET